MSTDPTHHRNADSSEPDPLAWASRHGAVDDVVQEMNTRVATRRRQRQRRRAFALGATALCLAASVGTLRFRTAFSEPTISPLAAASTAPTSATISRPERQTLADGSIVELKPGARIALAFSESLRRVELLAGEAHFQVAKNPHRPFVVAAGAMEFRAVGTAFSVQLGHAEVELLVTEGRVAVDRPREIAASAATTTASENPPPLALVSAGSKLTVPTQTEPAPLADRVERVDAAQLNERMAWRVPRLEFSGTPLGDAIALFNQHNRARLVLGDREVAHVRLSGILRADNVETLLVLLEESHGIHVEKRRGGEIVLRKRR